MPRKTRVHHRQHKPIGSEEGFISNDIKRTMTKNEKIIMGVLVGGIIIFLALSILVLFTKSKLNTTTTTTPVVPVNSRGEEVVISPYPTVMPIENMTVMVNERRFNPKNASIPKGGYVIFLNLGAKPITIEGNDQNSTMLNIGEIEPSGDKQVTFNESGTYTYRNKANPTQVGIIIVK